MENIQLPPLKKKNLTERFTLPMSPELKQNLIDLKKIHEIDVSEWIRQILKDKIASLDLDL